MPSWWARTRVLTRVKASRSSMCHPASRSAPSPGRHVPTASSGSSTVDLSSTPKIQDRARLPPRAQLRERAGLLLGRPGLVGGHPHQFHPGPLGDRGQVLQLAVVVDGGDVLVLQLGEAGGDLPAALRGPADQLVRHPSNLHDGSSARGNGTRLGREPQFLTDLSGHDFVVERGRGDRVLEQDLGMDRPCRPAIRMSHSSVTTWVFPAVSSKGHGASVSRSCPCRCEVSGGALDTGQHTRCLVPTLTLHTG